MPPSYKTISIIIATYNAATTLARCLESLTRCDLARMEIIIKDGGSTDGTMGIAGDYARRLPLRNIALRDSGIYDAWNQALERDGGPQGHWVLFLGADDFICSPKHFADTLEALCALPEHIDYASAPVTLVDGQGFAVDTLFPSRNLARDLPAGMPLPHQGLFHRRGLFAANRFDASLRITGDYDFLCRTLTKDNLAYLDTPAPVCMSLGGISGSLAGMARRNREALRVSKRFFPDNSRRVLKKRLLFSWVFNVINRVCGVAVAADCADRYRKLMGKTPVWRTRKSLPSTLRLPEQNITAEKSGTIFSLLVATLNRKEPLKRLFDSLLRQTISPNNFEVLIADQNPPHFLQPIIEAYAPHLRIRVVRVPNKGVSQARNALLPLAEGKYIAFPDDDCYYEPDTLREAQKIFMSHLHAHVVHGRWSAPGCAPSADLPANSLDSWRSIFKRGETYVQFFRREAVEHIGPFDPAIGPGTGLPYGCGEDTDYLLRAIKSGLTVMYAPVVHVHHNEVDVQTVKNNRKKILSYATGRMYLLYKHNLPLWFQLLNIVYPLLRIPVEGFSAVRYRFTMFRARLHGFFAVRSKSHDTM